MIKFIEMPNLPQTEVKTLICGKISNELYSFIKSFDIQIIYCEHNLKVDKRIANHVDISVHHLGGKEIIIDKNLLGLNKELQLLGMSISFPNKDISLKYPHDCCLNVAVINKYAIGKINCIDQTLLNHFDDNGVEIVNIKQGYSKCSVCVINENAIITDDESVYKAATNHHIEALLVSKGDIQLCGFNYGFIGGASGLIGKDHLLFFGDITKHRDYERIKDFLNNESCRFDYLKDYPLTDIGGIIPIIEK